jgi:hypothetical protein
MIFATTTINSKMAYIRIVSYSNPSYSVDTQSSFGLNDPYSGNFRDIRSIFIKDINNLRSLIFDKSNNLSYLAMIDFSAKTI